ncbi:nuclear transcription factor Y subunit B-1 [Elaeis guineensis]|uniref:Nuclear transcription factor Y subunit B-1-like n=1 Tax=Elaeis guineensis var. tenera TaxID=51953 RepID=A0A6I9S3F4_ELAGV|nr:nuclear transcription factor Y subunit B-1-like [Elaeis guineensis]
MAGSGTGGDHANYGGSSDGNPAAAAGQCSVREQDRFMPIANVIRIMRKVLPTHAKISDDAKETIQECVSEYISFITSEANERCQREQRKTITAEDVLWAMSKLGFDDYIEPLSLYLQRYRELEGDHRGSIRGEPLPTIRHRSPNPSTDVVPFFPQPPPPSFVVPPPSGPSHLNHLYGDGAGGYYYGMYGGGDGSGASTSQDPPMPGFDHSYAPYKQ